MLGSANQPMWYGIPLEHVAVIEDEVLPEDPSDLEWVGSYECPAADVLLPIRRQLAEVNQLEHVTVVGVGRDTVP